MRILQHSQLSERVELLGKVLNSLINDLSTDNKKKLFTNADFIQLLKDEIDMKKLTQFTKELEGESLEIFKSEVIDTKALKDHDADSSGNLK